MSAPASTDQVKKNYLTGLKEALDEEMALNPHMLCMGEDIGILGGAFGVTEGLQAKYGKDRVYDMPISEGGIVGTAVGAALNGKTVMVEMQFIDFISCGFDQIVNMCATYHYRTAGEVSMPLVIRGPAGGYGGGALYHSQMNEAWFANSPGLKIIVPSTPRDAKGLLKSALRNPDPVIFYEIKELYRKNDISEEIPDDELIPIGKASVRREGSDLTLVTYGNNVYHCLEAADTLAGEGYSVEVIDLRTLVPLDEETILESVKKTNRVVVVNEAPRTCGFAGEVVARISDLAFEHLAAPPLRVTRLDTPVPWVKPLEDFVLPNTDKVLDAARRVLKF
ncbi:MAG TPA: alpha-ketoacid dehydrogenase subunit beta [Fimbriimonadaceae bacterium]|nr:alpha-ketoacid dehydrogenase subunit beta [Fimbriimonadaceae bacterium]